MSRPRRIPARGDVPTSAIVELLGLSVSDFEARRPTLLLCYTRLLFTQALRRHMHDLLGYGLGMELLALGEKPEGPAR